MLGRGRRHAVLLVEIGGGGVVPDGLTVDADGGIWVAVWGGRAVYRYRPDGVLTATAELPAACVTCPTSGSAVLETMYITTAAGPGDGAGSLFAFRPGVASLPTHPYRG